MAWLTRSALGIASPQGDRSDALEKGHVLAAEFDAQHAYPLIISDFPRCCADSTVAGVTNQIV
jgi:hypothetical protein